VIQLIYLFFVYACYFKFRALAPSLQHCYFKFPAFCSLYEHRHNFSNGRMFFYHRNDPETLPCFEMNKAEGNSHNSNAVISKGIGSENKTLSR